MYKGKSHYHSPEPKSTLSIDGFGPWIATHNIIPIILGLVSLISAYFALLNRIDTNERNIQHQQDINNERYANLKDLIKGEVKGISTEAAKLTPIKIKPTIKP